uniref:ABC-type branched-chain amino acid transport system, substrate-binding protein n=1 Tax=Candidatus Kentrum sp. LPFa TaxID=2126335 RepID=A0A450VZ96_9GAMM|nr:MAG: ABC-type branched-chain amino acid transport system, substrate-binding protein [Candidatus Kentron sp. LPFa]VFK26101.1 MAG: ABC-type branched-chain amino acid transport system, substrate-binding protein [Candidatus Kentron sp. LPFa]
MNKTKMLIGAVVIFVAVGAVFMVQKGGGTSPESGVASIKIGAIYPLTGPASSLGQEFRRGVEIAVQMLASKQSPVMVAFEDSKTDPKAGMAAYQKLKSDNVNLLLTTVSSIALAIEPVARQDGALLFADVGYPEITGKNPLLFRHSSTAEQEANVIYGYVLSEQQKLVAGIMWVNDDYGAAFIKEVERLNGKKPSGQELEIYSTSYLKADSDLRSETAKILDSHPDVVVVVGYGKSMGLAIRRIRESGFQGKVIASMGFTVTPDAAATAGNAADGILYTRLDINESDEMFANFSNQYKNRYGDSPPAFAVLAHNSASLLIKAASESGENPENVAANILARGHYIGAGEKMEITPSGDILPPVSLQKYTVTNQ